MKPTLQVVDRDRGWRSLLKRVDAMRGGAYAKVGWLADDAKGGMRVEGGHLTVAEIAAVLEFGTEDDHIPARPALRPTFDAMREELARDAGRLLFLVLDGSLSVEKALGVLGAKLANAVKKYITTTPLPGIPPANAPLTALLKSQGSRAIAGGKKKSLGGQLADIGATEGMRQAAGYTWGKLGPIKAARNLGDAFAQIGAMATVRTWVDTGRTVGALTWAVVTGRDAREAIAPEQVGAAGPRG